MAARLNPRNSELARQKIKVSQLINALQKHALTGRKMANSRVRAACYLISQAIGNPPQHVELEAPPEETYVPEAELTDEELRARLAAIDARRKANGHSNGHDKPGKNGSANGSSNGSKHK